MYGSYGMERQINQPKCCMCGKVADGEVAELYIHIADARISDNERHLWPCERILRTLIKTIVDQKKTTNKLEIVEFFKTLNIRKFLIENKIISEMASYEMQINENEIKEKIGGYIDKLIDDGVLTAEENTVGNLEEMLKEEQRRKNIEIATSLGNEIRSSAAKKVIIEETRSGSQFFTNSENSNSGYNNFGSVRRK